MSSGQNPWGNYPRRTTANYKQILLTAFVHGICIAAFLACAYYALKCKPFQNMPSISNEPAHPVLRHNEADERLLNQGRRVSPIVKMPGLSGTAKKIAAGHHKPI